MNNKLSCDIVRDLLPSYADGLTSEQTNEAVADHLSGCADCAEALRLMREPEPPSAEPPEVDYLKKLRRRATGRSLITGIVLMLIGVLLLGFKLFYVGSRAEPTDVNYSVSVENGRVYVSGTSATGSAGVCRVVFSESAGMVNVTFYTAPKLFFIRNSFSSSYDAHGDVDRVRSGSLIMWENGVSINDFAARLFAAQNPYAGDMPANSSIASILDVYGQLGSYTSELQTAIEPYGLTFILENAPRSGEERAALDIMTADSYVMLALVGNLGSVTWEYPTETGSASLTVTEKDASEYWGGDIKLCGEDVTQLQELVNGLSIKWSGVTELPLVTA